MSGRHRLIEDQPREPRTRGTGLARRATYLVIGTAVGVLALSPLVTLVTAYERSPSVTIPTIEGQTWTSTATTPPPAAPTTLPTTGTAQARPRRSATPTRPSGVSTATAPRATVTPTARPTRAGS